MSVPTSQEDSENLFIPTVSAVAMGRIDHVENDYNKMLYTRQFKVPAVDTNAISWAPNGAYTPDEFKQTFDTRTACRKRLWD